MGLEANIVYLEEEIANLQERIAAIRTSCRTIRLRQFIAGASREKFITIKNTAREKNRFRNFWEAASFDFKGASRKLKAENEKVKKAKGQLAKLKKEILALKRQAKIARKAFEHVRV